MVIIRFFSFPDGKLYRNLPGTKNGVEVVLEGQQKAIFTEFHASSFGGHSGVNKTICAIQKRYWWNGLTEDIKKFVSFQSNMITPLFLPKSLNWLSYINFNTLLVDQ